MAEGVRIPQRPPFPSLYDIPLLPGRALQGTLVVVIVILFLPPFLSIPFSLFPPFTLHRLLPSPFTLPPFPSSPFFSFTLQTSSLRHAASAGYTPVVAHHVEGSHHPS